MSSFNFLDQYLSEVRHQKCGGQSAFVATIASVEMIYRILEITLTNWTEKYFFNIDDVFDNIITACRGIPKPEEKENDICASKGLKVEFILEYIKRNGLLASSCCYDPQLRNLLSYFNTMAPRFKIDSYEQLKHNEVVERVENFPVIAVMLSYKSFLKCRSVIYDGPTENENKIPANNLASHVVLIVGSVRVKNQCGWEQYVIVQNSFGRKFGFSGFIVMKFNKSFKEFWQPVILEMFDVACKRKCLDAGEQDDEGGASSRPLVM